MSLLSKIAKEKAFKDSIELVSTQKDAETFSTQSYALNGILSGNVFDGFPADTIIALCGESNSGKSIILANTVKSAQEKGYDILLFDSERAVRKNYYSQIGCDVNNIFRVPVGSTMEFRNSAFKYIERYYEEAGPDNKLFVGLDSLGNLASEKELADAEKEKSAADQGNNAKAQNSAMRVISSLASKYNFPCVFTNHVYANIGDMFAQRGVIAGGAKSIYNSHIICYFERLVNKEEVENELGKTVKQDVGIRIKITTIKNRNYVENQSVYLNLRYDTGINPYSGLLPLAIKSGVIENKSRGFLVTETGKTVFEKDLYTNQIFNDAALQRINEYLGQNGYSSLSNVFSDELAAAIGEPNVQEESE